MLLRAKFADGLDYIEESDEAVAIKDKELNPLLRDEFEDS